MPHGDIDTTIESLREKAESIRSEMHKNAEIAVHRGTGDEPVNPERLNRGMEAMERNRELRPKLAEIFDNMGRAYQQKGNERVARFYFNQAETERPITRVINNKFDSVKYMLKGCQQRIELIGDELISDLSNEDLNSRKKTQSAVVHLSRIVDQAETLKQNVLEMFD